MKRLTKLGSAVEEAFTSLLMLAIVLLVFLAAVTRYFGTPINWSVDVAQALFVWIVFIGAHQAMRESRHIGISLVVSRLGRNWRTAAEIFVDGLLAVFLAAIIMYGVQVSVINVRRVLTSAPISYSWVTMAVPAGAFLMLVSTVIRIGMTIRRAVRNHRQQGLAAGEISMDGNG